MIKRTIVHLLAIAGLFLLLLGCFAPGQDARNKLTIQSMSAGAGVICAQWSSGDLYCWGRRAELLGSPLASLPRPFRVARGIQSHALSVGDLANGSTLCTLDATRIPQCRGLDASGVLGRGSVSPPVTVPGFVPIPREIPAPVNAVGNRFESGGGDLTNVVQLAGMRATMCALLDSGQVACWGSNRFRNLGVPVIPPAVTPPVPPPFNAVNERAWPELVEGITAAGAPAGVTSPLEGVQKIESGRDHLCALLQNHQVVCWGRNETGQTGRGAIRTIGQNSPGRVIGVGQSAGGSPLTHVRQLKAFRRGACALVHNPVDNIYNEVRCWGANVLGNGEVRVGDLAALGLMMDGDRPVKVELKNGQILRHVSYLTGTHGTEFACAIVTPSQDRYCWGVDPLFDQHLPRAEKVTYQGIRPTDEVITSVVAKDQYLPMSPESILSASCLWLLGGVKCLGDNRTGLLGQQGVMALNTGNPQMGPSGSLPTSAGFAGDGDGCYGPSLQCKETIPGAQPTTLSAEPASETLAALPFLQFPGLP